MPEIIAAVITLAVGAVSSGALASIENRLAGNRSRARDRREREDVVSASGVGPFTWAWGAAVVVGIAVVILVLVADVPTEDQLADDAYEQFFATSAQISAALIIALAIESGTKSDDEGTAFKVEACACVALGALAALLGLVPDLPEFAYEAALMIVPPGVVGGLVGVVAIAVRRRTAAG